MFHKKGFVLLLTLFSTVFSALPSFADWSSAATLSPNGDAENIRLAVDPSGNVQASWQLAVANTEVVQSSLLPSGGSWGALTDISDPSDVLGDHELAVDWSGNAYAVWNPIQYGEDFILGADRPWNVTWTSSTILQYSPQQWDRQEKNPRVAAKVWGTAVSVWTGTTGTNSIIQSASFDSGAWILPAVTISDPSQNADHAAIGVDGSGNAVAVFESNDGYNTKIWASLNVGGVWSAPYQVSYDGSDALSPQVAVNSQGNAVAVWKRWNGGSWIIESATLADESWWTLPIELSLPLENADLPQVGIDYYGNAIATWKRFNGSNYVIQASALLTGRGWTRPASISAVGEDADTPEIAVNDAGQAVVVWSRSNGTNAIVEASTTTIALAVAHPSSDFWTAPVDLSAAGADALLPRVTIDPSGNAVVGWQYGTTGAYAIQAVVGTSLF